MSIIDTLITDRTEQDVVEWQTLKDVEYSLMSLDQKSKWDSDMKGAYNYTDLNRIGQAIAYLVERMKKLAVYDSTIVPKTDWAVGDVPLQSQISTLLTNLTALREKLSLPTDAPTVPTSLDALTYQTANDLEELLFIIDDRISRAVSAFSYAGISYCEE